VAGGGRRLITKQPRKEGAKGERRSFERHKRTTRRQGVPEGEENFWEENAWAREGMTLPSFKRELNNNNGEN